MEEEKKEELEGEESLDIEKNKEIYLKTEIKMSKVQYSIFEIKRKYERKIDFLIDPDFQRESVWEKNKQKSELIESILMGIPIQLIYFFETKEGVKEVVDGRQRITTIVDFLNNKFYLKDLKILGDLNGKRFNDLEPILQTKIEDYQLEGYVIQPPTPEKVKFDIFDRINRGGTKLNKQEMRNALYQGNATEILKELSSLEEFKKATGYSVKETRMKDRYIILRFIAFYLLKNGKLNFDYKNDIDEFLAKVMKEYLNSKKYEEIIYLKDIFIKSMKISIELFGEDGFRFESNKIKRPVNMLLFELLGYLYAKIDFNNIDKDLLKEKIIEFKKNHDGKKYFINNIEGTKGVNYRFDEIDKLIEELKSDYKN